MSRIGNRGTFSEKCPRCGGAINRIPKSGQCGRCNAFDAQNARIESKKAAGAWGNAEKIDWN